MAEWYTCKCKECTKMNMKDTKKVNGVSKAWCSHFRIYEDPEHKACCREHFEYNPKSKKVEVRETSKTSLLIILVIISILAIIVNL